MKRGELEHRLSRTNPWWRSGGQSRSWSEDDRELKQAAAAGFMYEPSPLGDLQSGGLYILFGPRRVGKSVELKRVVARLIDGGEEPRRVVHADCEGWRAQDLHALVDTMDGLAPPAEGPRHVLLDEITAIRDDWVAAVKWLRDNTSLGEDCVVLSGSSAERLDEARKSFAGRRGRVVDSDRTLMPMGFRAFCRATGVALPEIPAVHPRDIFSRDAQAAIRELRVYMNDLVPSWERYLEVGGFPRAVDGWIAEREVPADFLRDLWDIVHGDALRGDWSPAESQLLLEQLSARLANPFNVKRAAYELGVHPETLQLRLKRLTRSFIAWPCFQNDERDRPRLRVQRKLYFLDPLYGRLASLRAPEARPPDYTVLSEQQLGVCLLRSHEAEAPGTLADYDTLLYRTTPARKEIDFTGAWLGEVPYEGKYTEGPWRREALTALAAYGRCVFATRTVMEQDGNSLAIPVSILAVLIDPTPWGAAGPQG